MISIAKKMDLKRESVMGQQETLLVERIKSAFGVRTDIKYLPN